MKTSNRPSHHHLTCDQVEEPGVEYCRTYEPQEEESTAYKTTKQEHDDSMWRYTEEDAHRRKAWKETEPAHMHTDTPNSHKHTYARTHIHIHTYIIKLTSQHGSARRHCWAISTSRWTVNSQGRNEGACKRRTETRMRDEVHVCYSGKRSRTILK